MTPAQLNALWVPIASNVVGLRAQYGWDTSSAADMHVDAYCRSRLTTASAVCPAPDVGATIPNTACDWTRIVTLRLALVTRNAEMASGGVNASDATLTLWPDSAATPTTTGPTFSVPSQQYRYKVFQSTTPIRNVIWLGAQSSCT
jgi:type IV pilus assembly protein PilW